MLAAAVTEHEGGRERRCIATGAVLPEERLVRFVIGPEGDTVPDIDAKLPGRGLWLCADARVMARAAARNDFSRAAKAPVRVPADLAARVERLLAGRLCSDLGLARRAGLLVQGYDTVARSLDGKIPPSLLVEASDGAPDGRRKLLAAAAARDLHLAVIDVLSSAELGLALGRENVIHAAVRPGPLADRLVFNSARLKGFRAADATAGPSRNERDV